ncbi:MAG: 2-amino-4-hydroxy-6-hydroxymethyldihydropteridine diphosphokinase [Verrucomicrobiota bacterium]
MPLTTAHLALGSNRGDRLEHLRMALRRLEADGDLLVVRASRIYENRAVGMGEADPFFNAAVEVATALSAAALLDRCLSVEESLGRTRGSGWLPRTIDIDILRYGSQVADTPRLQLPHPRVVERDFVLRPLADIDRDLKIGRRTVDELLAALPVVELKAVDATLWPMPGVHLIAAVAENHVIGVDGHLPWSIPEDWEIFLNKTKGGTLVMGRLSFEGMQREPTWQEDRRYVVVTSRSEVVEGLDLADACADVGAAVDLARRDDRPVWICGGQGIYEAALPLADQFHVTEVLAEYEGDTYFPEYRAAFPKVLASVDSQDADHSYRFQVLGR